MKKFIQSSANRYLLLLLFVLAQFKLWAQDSTIASTADKAGNFFEQHWMWIVAGVVVLIILIAAFSGKSSDKRTIVTKTTVIKEQEVI